MSSIQDLRENLADAERWGDITAAAELREQIREHEDYVDHCHECAWEAQREDARLESYWEQFDA